jgi:hypothetical protein
LPFRKARSIDELERRVDGADLVLTSDAPLALALNRRVDGPELGTFASTPRNYVKQGLEVADRRDLFHRVVQATELGFKQAANRLDLALDAWEHTGRLDAILDHDAHDRPETRAVLDVLERTESSHSLRADLTLPSNLDVAVIGFDAFSPLDRSLIGDVADIDVVNPFSSDTFELPRLDELASIPELVQTLEAHLTPDNADDVAIVLDPGGPVRPLVEAMLDARGIAYHAEEALAEHGELRSFLRALRKGQARDRLTGRQVRALLVELGLDASIRHDARRVSDIDTYGVDRLRDFWTEAEDATLSTALSAFEALVGPMTDLREVLAELDIGDEPATPATLNALEFYLETFRVERDYTREGVLLASGRDNAYVDRPLVFYVGLGTNWAKTQPTYPWIDDDEQTRLEETDLARFERLLQNGQRQVHLVQDTRRGQPVTPCFHLHELLDEEFERFAELDPRPRKAPAIEQDPDGFIVDPPDVEPREVATLSASTLDLLTHCPRDWYLDELVAEPDHDAIERGQLFHQFARAYVSNPHALAVHDPDVLDQLVTLALDRMGGLVDPDEHAPLATELAIGFANIAAWLDENSPTGSVPEAYTTPPPDRRDDDNPFAEALRVEVDQARTERWFADPEVGVHGKVDLVHGPTRLVDYKSTRNPDSLTKTVRKTRVHTDETPPRLQPGVYLAHHREAVPDARLSFAFVDLLGNRKDVIRGDDELASIQREIPYHPDAFTAYAASEHAYERLRDTADVRERLLDEISYETYRDAMTDGELPDFEDKDAAKAHPACKRLEEAGKTQIGDYKYVTKGARSVFKKLVDLKRRGLFAEDVDRIDEHVQATAENLDTWLRSRFPAPDTVDRDDLQHPQMVLFDLDAHRRRSDG